MSVLDSLIDRASRHVAQRTSRRGFLQRVSKALFAGAALPLLPVARADNGYPGVGEQSTGVEGDPGDPSSCDYWRYCAIDGFLCSCCGGTSSSCPPGTEMSPITWIGICKNPEDGLNYAISYNDCCGQTSCGRCLCNNNQGDRPVYMPFANNDINWCVGASSTVYTCSVGAVIGVSDGAGQ